MKQADMVFDEASEDLALDKAGRLMYESRDIAVNAVIRRAATPLQGYARMVRVGDQTEVLNPSYYTDLPMMLSSSEATPTDIQNAISNAAAADGRIVIEEAELLQNNLGKVDVSLRYSLVSNQTNEIFSTTAALQL